jgi:hypothetical protein
MKHIKLFENFVEELNEKIRIVFSANGVSDKAKDVWNDETEKKGLNRRSSYTAGDYIDATFRDGNMRITVDKKDAAKVKSIVGKAAGGSKVEIETEKWNPKEQKWETVDQEGAKKAEDDAKSEAKKKGDELKKALGENPDAAKVANYVWNNWKKITGLSNSERNDEAQFPQEVQTILKYYKIDYTDFSDAWSDKAEK